MSCSEMAWSRRTSVLYLLAVAGSALISTMVSIERSRPVAFAGAATAAAKLQPLAGSEAPMQTTGDRDVDGS